MPILTEKNCEKKCEKNSGKNCENGAEYNQQNNKNRKSKKTIYRRLGNNRHSQNTRSKRNIRDISHTTRPTGIHKELPI